MTISPTSRSTNDRRFTDMAVSASAQLPARDLDTRGISRSAGAGSRPGSRSLPRRPTANPTGLIVNSLTSVSLEPPLIAFCPARSSLTWQRMRRTGRFGVNVLARRARSQFARRAALARRRPLRRDRLGVRAPAACHCSATRWPRSSARSSPSTPPGTTGSWSGGSTGCMHARSASRSSSSPARSECCGSSSLARRPSARDEPVHGTAQRDGVDVPGVVLAERRQAADRQARRMVIAGAPGTEQDRVDLRLAVVAVQVAAVERAQRAVANDVAADDRAVPVAVPGDEDGRDRAGRGPRLVAAIALEDAPAVVRAGAVAVARRSRSPLRCPGRRRR